MISWARQHGIYPQQPGDSHAILARGDKAGKSRWPDWSTTMVLHPGQPHRHRCLIVDLSFLEGASVNDSLDSQLCSLQYVSVDNVAQVLARLGQGSFLSKVDIRSAYRTVLVHPEDRWLLGMEWDGQLFVDAVLPFGLRSAPKIYSAVADAAECMARAGEVHIL